MKTYIRGNARFTVIEDGLVRMEYSKNGAFCDEETLFARRDYMKDAREDNIKDGAECPVSVSDENGVFTLETPLITLSYKDNGRPFNRRNLTGRLNISDNSDNSEKNKKSGEKRVFWYPAKKDTENLGGALSTLDGVSGSVPLPQGLISRGGWHMLDDSSTTVIRDGWICERDENHVCDYYLFVYGHDYKGALRSLAALSGKAALPRRYAFGSWYSRWYPYTSRQLREIVSEYEENGFPLDILVIDMDWHHNDWQTPEGHPRRTKYGFGHGGGNMGWTGYSWNEKLIPDPEEMLCDIREKGVAVTLNDHPADGVRSNEECYGKFAEMMGLKNGENIPFLCGDKKYMEAFFASALEPCEKLGVDFWWLDWQQDYIIPSVPGFKNQKVLPWLNRLYFEHSKKDSKRGQIYSRWGGVGDQKHPMFFSGDTIAAWDALKFEIEMTAASSNSLCFFWGHDIGGFASPDGTRDSEMFIRWVQFGAVSASLKLHSCGDNMDRRPWTWGKEAASSMRKAFLFRRGIMPFIYSAAFQSCRDSAPFIEPLYYEEPLTEESYRNSGEFLIGGALAAPICEKGEICDGGAEPVAKKRVFLPSGVWYNFFTGEMRRGGEFTEECGLDSFPFYVKAGRPFPMQNTSKRDASDELIVRLYPPQDGCLEDFTLYEDDGVSQGYLSGEYLMTKIVCRREKDDVSLTFTPSGAGYKNMPESRRVTLELVGIPKLDTALSHETVNNTSYIYTTAEVLKEQEIKFKII